MRTNLPFTIENDNGRRKIHISEGNNIIVHNRNKLDCCKEKRRITGVTKKENNRLGNLFGYMNNIIKNEKNYLEAYEYVDRMANVGKAETKKRFKDSLFLNYLKAAFNIYTENDDFLPLRHFDRRD